MPQAKIRNADIAEPISQAHGGTGTTVGAVPYTGATNNVDLNNRILTNVNLGEFNAYFIQPNELGGLVGGMIPDSPGLPILEFGVNAFQFDSYNIDTRLTDTTYNGGLFRFDNRGFYPFFQILYQPLGAADVNDQQPPLIITNPNGAFNPVDGSFLMPSVLIGSLGNGDDNEGTNNGENLQVWGNASIGAQFNNGGGSSYAITTPGVLGVGMSLAQYALDVYDINGSGYDLGNSTTGGWHVDSSGRAKFNSLTTNNTNYWTFGGYSAPYVNIGINGTLYSLLTSAAQTPAPIQASTSRSIVVNQRYYATSTSLVTFTLPTVAALGDQILIRGTNTGGWKLAQNAGQTIHGATNTTTGTGGSLASQARYDCVTLENIVANTDWIIINQRGTLSTV